MTCLKPIGHVIRLLTNCAIILWFTGFVDQISAQPDLCHFIDTREFTSIGLQSISWDDSYELLIFTEPQYRFYSLSSDKVAEHSLDMTEAKAGSIAERDKYDRAISLVKDQSLKATYMFRLDNYFIFNRGQKHIILLVTNKGTLSGNFQNDAKEVVEPSGEELQDFSLASFSKDLKILRGYVITSGELTCSLCNRLSFGCWSFCQIFSATRPTSFSASLKFTGREPRLLVYQQKISNKVESTFT